VRAVGARVYAPAMNRTDRLYALVEELRAAGRAGRTAKGLAERFEVSVRTIERDLSALGQAGVPLATRQGRRGGYSVERSMTLPPLNFTPDEAAAVAVALSRDEHVLFRRDARTALQKIVSAMPEGALEAARAAADRVRLLVLATPDPDAEVAQTIWQAVRDNQVLRITYVDVGGVETERDIEPRHVLVGPHGSFLTAWCQLRSDERIFRMDRITHAVATHVAHRAPSAVPEPVVDGHETRLPAEALGRSDPSTNTDIALSRRRATVGTARRSGG
jgi:predicted DNA-binding transcriptional regulator YafY